jgi:O-antigen/teichoic acid export membrane protein
MSLMPRILRGSAVNVVEQMLRLVCALWITPRMVWYLEESGYGLWIILSTLFGQFILLDPGLGASLARFLARAESSGDQDGLRRALSTGTFFFFGLSGLALLLGSVIWLQLPQFETTAADLEEAQGVVSALAVTAGFYWLVQPIRVHLKSRLRQDLIAGAAIIRVLICTLLVAWALEHGKGLAFVAWIHTLGSIGEGLLLAGWNRSFFPLVRGKWADREKAMELLRFSRWTYVMTSSERLRNEGDPLLLGAMLGPGPTGLFALGQRLVRMYFDVAYAVVGTQLLSAFSYLDGLGDRELLRRAYLSASRFASMLAVLGAGMIWVVGPPFLQRWVPPQAAQATPVLLWLTPAYLVYAAQIPGVHLLVSLGRHRLLAWVHLGGLILNVAASVALVYSHGMIGAAWGTALELILVYGLALPLLVVRRSGLSASTVFWQALWQPMLRTAVVLAPAWLLTGPLLAQPDYSMIALAILGQGGLFLVAMPLGLLGAEAKDWSRRGLDWLKQSRLSRNLH